MNKKELQHRAGILNEDYHITSRNLLTNLVSPDDLVWETDGIPPAPSNAERAQVNAGKINADILGLKRRAGLIEDETFTECPGPDGSMDAAREKIRSVMQALQQPGRATGEMMYARLSAALDDLESASQESEAVHTEEQY